MMFGAYGKLDHDDAVKIIHRALDAGTNFIDTADAYSGGESELIVGKALAGGRRESVVLATKVSMPLGEDPNQRGTSRRWIAQAVEAIAFVTRHPAVTSASIGPRMMEHLETYLAADGVELSTDLLDRIDEIVPPGDTVNIAANMWSFGTSALEAASRRR